MNVPVLIIAYKKVETTKAVIEGLRRCLPTRVYVALNAPIPNSKKEKDSCRTVTKLFENIDWETEVKFLRRETNLPVTQSYLTACDWFFDQVEAGIVLDDDCVPSSDFSRLVAFFIKNRSTFSQVGHINGSQFVKQKSWLVEENSFFMTRYASCWGWATWRDEWKRFDRNLYTIISPEKLWDICLNNSGDKIAARRAFWVLFGFGKLPLEDRVAPDWLWTLHLWSSAREIVSPAVNLIQNVGIGSLEGVTYEWTKRESKISGLKKGDNLTQFESKVINASREFGTLPEVIQNNGDLKPCRTYEKKLAKLYVSISIMKRFKFYLGEVIRMLRGRSMPFPE